MKNRPVHENLDTSFVNLPALVRHLRGENFAGNICVELKDYDADIILAADGSIKARKYDRAAGRVAEGEEALQRVLIRAREPGGVIHVFRAIEEIKEQATNKLEVSAQEGERIVGQKSFKTSIDETDKSSKPFHVQNIKLNLPAANANQNGRTQTITRPKPAIETNAPKPQLPFEFTNRVEDKARQTNLAPEDWRTLLNLTAELLTTIDDVLAKANLDFSSAFEQARLEVSADYPFLHPKSSVFDYKNGKITMSEQTNHKIFVAGINETLRRVLDKLAKHPKFSNLYRTLAQNILALLTARKPLYDKFSITPQLEKTISV